MGKAVSAGIENGGSELRDKAGNGCRIVKSSSSPGRMQVWRPPVVTKPEERVHVDSGAIAKEGPRIGLPMQTTLEECL